MRAVDDVEQSATHHHRAGGLGVVGPEDTLEALLKGQVEELLISASVRELQPVGANAAARALASVKGVLPEPAVEATAAGEAAQVAPETARLADELITKATQTAARITFVEDPELLAAFGGVAAILRFTI